MGYAKHVGRVGALAVALGIGAAVATTPGIAWADGVEDSSAAQDTNVSEGGGGTTTNPGSVEPGSSEVEERRDPGETIRNSIERTATTLRTVVSGVVRSSGGAMTSTHRTGRSTADEGNKVAAGSEPMKKDSRRTAFATDDNVPAPSHIDVPSWRSVHAQTSGKPAPEIAAKALGDVERVVQQAISTVGTRQHAPNRPPVVDRVTVAPTTVSSAAEPREVRTPFVAPVGIVTHVLNAALAPFLNPTPGRPAPDNPILWGVLAFVRRQFQDSPFGKIVLNRTPVLDQEKSQSLVVDQGSGRFLITPSASDPDGDDLTYTITPAENDTGTVTDNYDGTFTYEVSDPGAWDKSDVLNVTVSDEQAYPHLHGLSGFFIPDGGHTDTIQLTIKPTATAAPEVVELPTGYTVISSSSLGTVGPDGKIYRATTNDASGTYALVVQQLGGDTEIIDLSGEPIGDVAFGPTGGVYQNIRTPKSDDSGGYDYAVAVIRPAPSTSFARMASNALESGSSTAPSAPLPGEPIGQMAFNSDGTGYQPVRAPGAPEYSRENCLVAIVSPDGSTVQAVPLTGQLLNAPLEDPNLPIVSSVTAGPGHTAYVTTVDTSTQTVTVWRIDADTADAEEIPLPGDASQGATIWSDGTAYITTRAEASDGTSDTKLWIIAPTEATAKPFQLEGYPSTPVVVGDDGIAYVTTFATDSNSVVYTKIWRVDPAAATVPTPVTVQGTPFYSVVVAPDGTVYQTVQRNTDDGDPNTPDPPQYLTAVVLPTGTTATLVDLGNPTFRAYPLAMTPGGVAYQAVADFDSTTSVGDSTMYVFDGATFGTIPVEGVITTPPVVGADGTVYVVAVTNGNEATLTGDETLWMFSPNSAQPSKVPIQTEGIPLEIRVGGNSLYLKTIHFDQGAGRYVYNVVAVAIPSQAV